MNPKRKIYRCTECNKKYFEKYLPRFDDRGFGCCKLGGLEEYDKI